MITAYARTDKGVTPHTVSDGAALPAGTFWVDMLNPSTEARDGIERMLHLRVPPLRAVRLLEQSRQHFIERNNIYVVLPTIVNSQTTNPTSGTILLITNGSIFVTVREADSRAVKNFAERLHRDPKSISNAAASLVMFLHTFADRLADIAELISNDLERVSGIVFQESLERSKAPGRGKPDSWRKVLQGLGSTARRNHRLIDALVGAEKVNDFLRRHCADHFDALQLASLIELQHDFNHLHEQTSAMTTESTFLLDAIVGAISIEQNNVIKIFSMVSVILMPPTMVASIYGMNFVHMPELAQVWGYPVALVLILISAYVPWWWFKKNGWF